MQLDSPKQLSYTTITLHWTVAIMMIGLLVIGSYMEDNHIYALYPWHKSFGITVAFLASIRIFWRIKNGWPQAVGNHTKIERILTKVVHYTLISGTLIMPISGIIMSVMGGHGLQLFGIELLAQNFDLANPDKILPIDKSIARTAREIHSFVSDIIIYALVLHIAGGIKHHLIDKDGTLRRIFGLSA